MSIGEQASDSPASPLSQAFTKDTATETGAPDGAKKRFTGVVLIHGLGLIPRNSMLQQVLNTLSYWFNHEAGLGLSPHGPARLWLNPHLTDDPDPDQPASRATVEVVAPGPKHAPDDRGSAVRLEFREVWWAESFGMPDIGQTISWAQVQWREQAARLLIPIRWRRRPAYSATTAPVNAESTKGAGHHTFFAVGYCDYVHGDHQYRHAALGGGDSSVSHRLHSLIRYSRTFQQRGGEVAPQSALRSGRGHRGVGRHLHRI